MYGLAVTLWVLLILAVIAESWFAFSNRYPRDSVSMRRKKLALHLFTILIVVVLLLLAARVMLASYGIVFGPAG
jgi:hypothetical protein